MSRVASEYWQICADAILDEAGIETTREQRAKVALGMEDSHDMYGEANGHAHHSMRASPPPKPVMLEPRNVGTRAYMDGSAPDETYIIEFRHSPQSFHFHGQRAREEAWSFYRQNQ